MTSATTAGFTISASSQYDANFAAWKACDGNSATSWAMANNIFPSTWQVQCPTGVSIWKYEISKRNGSGDYMNEFYFEGSIDSINWITLAYTASGEMTSLGLPPAVLTKFVDDPSFTPYTYYRLRFLSGVTAVNPGMSIFQMYKYDQTTSVATGTTGPTGPNYNGGTLTQPIIMNQQGQIISTKTGATGNVTHDWATNSVYYHTSVASNFTANIINLPTTALQSYTFTLIFIQGATPYYANIVEIEGVQRTINWLNGTPPTPVANNKEIQTFTIVNISATVTPSWIVLCEYKSYT
jgi:hypothetical protein